MPVSSVPEVYWRHKRVYLERNVIIIPTHAETVFPSSDFLYVSVCKCFTLLINSSYCTCKLTGLTMYVCIMWFICEVYFRR